MINIVEVKEDLTGKVFDNWTVICRAEDYINPNTGKRLAQWLCECNCNKHTRKIIAQGRLRGKEVLQCCSYKSEQTSKRSKGHNTYDLSGKYGIGYTQKGEEFWFDLEDYDLIKDYYWSKDKDDYFVTRVWNKTYYKRVSLHRLIMKFPDVTDIDHIHGKESKHDNRKSNLRVATHSQNGMNRD